MFIPSSNTTVLTVSSQYQTHESPLRERTEFVENKTQDGYHITQEKESSNKSSPCAQNQNFISNHGNMYEENNFHINNLWREHEKKGARRAG